MRKLIKCHFYYLFNKVNIFIIIVSIVFSIGFLVVNAISLDDRISNNFKGYEFYNNCFQIIKIVLSFDSIFIFGYSFCLNNDYYRVIIINNQIKRIKYFISKVIVLFFVIFIIYFILFLSLLIISISFNLYLDNNMIYSFFTLFIFCLFYSNFTITLILLINNIYIIFIPFFISFVNINDSFNIIKFIIPILHDNLFILNPIYYILILIFLFLINLIIWNNKDL